MNLYKKSKIEREDTLLLVADIQETLNNALGMLQSLTEEGDLNRREYTRAVTAKQIVDDVLQSLAVSLDVFQPFLG